MGTVVTITEELYYRHGFDNHEVIWIEAGLSITLIIQFIEPPTSAGKVLGPPRVLCSGSSQGPWSRLSIFSKV